MMKLAAWDVKPILELEELISEVNLDCLFKLMF